MKDLQCGVLRVVGGAERRCRGGPVRMLRAVRFAAKLGFRIDPDSEAAIVEMGHLLEEIPPARLFDEVLKLFQGGTAVQRFALLRHYGLFRHLFPQSEAALAQEQDGFPKTLVLRALANTDQRIAEDMPVTPAFLYAALLWAPLRQVAAAREAAGESELQAIQEEASEVVDAQLKHSSLLMRFALPMREICVMQPRLRRITCLRPANLLDHPRFRAAYDFQL